MNEELIEMCRLTDDEVKAEIAKYDLFDVEASNECIDVAKYLIAIVREAQLLKAIPIIQREERERIILNREYDTPIISGYGEIHHRLIMFKITEEEWQSLERGDD